MRVAHLLLGTLVERDEADRSGRETPGVDQVTGPLGQHPGLAGTGRRDDPGGPPGVRDGRQLVGREVGSRRIRSDDGESTVVDLDLVHDADSVDLAVIADRSGGEPDRMTVRRHDVARRAAPRLHDRRAGLDGAIDQRPTAGRRVACVDGVRPHELVKIVELERVSDSHLVGQAILRRTGWFVELGRQLDHEPGRGVRSRTQQLDGGSGVRDCSPIDRDPRRAVPLGGCRSAGADDDIATERRRASPDGHVGATAPLGPVTRSGGRERRERRGLRGVPVGRLGGLLVGSVDQDLFALVVGPTLLHICGTLMLPAAVDAADHDADPTDGVRARPRARRPARSCGDGVWSRCGGDTKRSGRCDQPRRQPRPDSGDDGEYGFVADESSDGRGDERSGHAGVCSSVERTGERPALIRVGEHVDEVQPRRHAQARRGAHRDRRRKQHAPPSGGERHQTHRRAQRAQHQPGRRGSIRTHPTDPDLRRDDQGHREHEHESGDEDGHPGHRRSKQDREQSERQRRQPEHAERRRHHHAPELTGRPLRYPEVRPNRTATP